MGQIKVFNKYPRKLRWNDTSLFYFNQGLGFEFEFGHSTSLKLLMRIYHTIEFQKTRDINKKNRKVNTRNKENRKSK